MNNHIEFEKKGSWHAYAGTLAKVLILITLSLFTLGIYFTHLNSHISTIVFAILMVLTFLFIVFGCIKLLINRLPIAALMLLIPIAPLALLILIVSLLPIIQMLR